MRFFAHSLTLRQLQYVIAVADTGSFRRAATLCGVSQPALSTQLAQAEQALGTLLFERDRRGVLVTAAGRDIVERARRIVVELDELVLAASAFADPNGATLRVGVIPTVSPYFLHEAALALQHELPRLTVVWREEKTGDLLRLLESGDVDAAIVALDRVTAQWPHAVLADDPFLLATPADDPRARGPEPVSLGALATPDLLVLDEGHCLREQTLAVCGRNAITEQRYRATNLATLLQMVVSGLGTTLVPRLALASYASPRPFAVRRLSDSTASRRLALVWRRGSALIAALRQVAPVFTGAFERLAKRVEKESPKRAGRSRQRGSKR